MAIPLTCSSCGHGFKVKDELAGKRIKCPKCKEVMKVTVAQEEEPEPEEEEEVEERPKKKKKKKGKKNNTLLIGSAIGGGVLIVAIVLYLIFSGSGDLPQKKMAKKKETPPAVKPAVQAPVAEEDPPEKKRPTTTGAGRARDRIERDNIMKQLGIACKQIEAEHNRGPKDQKELAPYYQNIREINEALTNKWVTVIYGTNRNSYPEGTSNTIMIYETDVDGQGIRIVVMGDGSVQSMSDDEFQKTPKAKGK